MIIHGMITSPILVRMIIHSRMMSHVRKIKKVPRFYLALSRPPSHNAFDSFDTPMAYAYLEKCMVLTLLSLTDNEQRKTKKLEELMTKLGVEDDKPVFEGFS